VEHGPELIYDWRECGAALSVDLRTLEDGSYTVAVRTVDPAGNTGAPVTTAYRLDTTVPDAPSITARPSRADAAAGRPSWEWEAEARAIFECRLMRGSEVVEPWAPCTSPQTFDLAGEPADGYTFLVRATDVAGNTSEPAEDTYAQPVTPGSAGEAGGGPGAGSAGPGAPGPAAAAAPATGTPAASPATADSTPRTANSRSNGDSTRRQGRMDGREGGGVGGAKASGGSGAAALIDAGKRARGHAGERERGERREDGPRGILGGASEQLAKATEFVSEHPEGSAFPLSLMLLIGLFTFVQGRIDRSDPKLAEAPVFSDPELDFAPPHAGDRLQGAPA
jgi:hypothetical protein